MIQAIIIDDEQHCIDRLDYLLSTYAGGLIQVAGAYMTVEKGVQAINSLKPDLVFLDIEVGRDTAFDLLAAFGRIDFEVIFTTAYEQYAVKAFRFSALDYLLKPIDRDELLASLDRLQERVSQQDRAEKFDVLFDNLKKQAGTSRRITIPTVNGFHFITTDEIVRCQADINYTHLFLKNNQKITVAKPLKDFEEMLGEYRFYRIHNSHLINLDYISSYVKGKGGYVIMKDQTEIEVSTRKKEGFLKTLKQI